MIPEEQAFLTKLAERPKCEPSKKFQAKLGKRVKNEKEEVEKVKEVRINSGVFQGPNGGAGIGNGKEVPSRVKAAAKRIAKYPAKSLE